MVLSRQTGEIHHGAIRDLPEWLRPHDCLVLNDSRVLPARLLGRRVATGGHWEGLYLGNDATGAWRMIGQTRGYLRAGESVAVDGPHGTLTLRLLSREPGGVFIFQPEQPGTPVELLAEFGQLPLPPYLERQPDEQDRERYQTVYAASPGSIAAPTAGLHFTPELLQRCMDRGATTARVTLHVGLGTFRPVAVENLQEHLMHSEWCEVSDATVKAIDNARSQQGRVVAVGTTSLRTLESAALANTPLAPWQGETQLFIRPPYSFQVVDVLLTNFHLPKSTLLMLVSAFAGLELTRRAYDEAIRERYRFFSYGDAMLIV